MLVLSRKKNQTIMIGQEIEIHILQVSGNRIRLGINAPHNVRVMRGELKPHDLDDQADTDLTTKVTTQDMVYETKKLYTAQAG